MKIPNKSTGSSIEPPTPLQPNDDNNGQDQFGGNIEPRSANSMIPSEDNGKPFSDKPFDADVEANEQTDPKKYIEQLTGKLAQTLRDYNKDQSDSDLNKFVINSIIPASIPSMDNEDTKDVIDKVNDNIGKSNNDGSESDTSEIPEIQDTGNENGEMGVPEQPRQQNEETIDSLIGEIINRRNTKNKTTKTNPFKAKKFK